MAYIVGVVLAAVLCGFGTVVGLDRDRGFYPTQMIVIALLYGLFAAMSGSTRVLMMESISITLFIVAAVIGFKTNLWIVAVALAAHGVYDFLHPRLFDNPGRSPLVAGVLRGLRHCRGDLPRVAAPQGASRSISSRAMKLEKKPCRWTDDPSAGQSAKKRDQLPHLLVAQVQCLQLRVPGGRFRSLVVMRDDVMKGCELSRVHVRRTVRDTSK